MISPLAAAARMPSRSRPPSPGRKPSSRPPTGDARRCRVQHVEAVPVVLDHPGALGDLARQAEDRGAVRPGQRAHAEHDHGLLGLGQLHRVLARGDRAQGLRPRAQILDVVGQIGRRPDSADPEAATHETLAQARVDHRGFPTRVGADQQAGVGPLDAGNRGVEEIGRARRARQLGAVLPALQVRRAQPRHQVLEREHGLGVAEVAGQGRDLLALERLEAIGDDLEGFGPARRLELAVGAAHIGPVEPLAAQAVAGVARLVGDPLLVDVLVQPRQHAQHLAPARVDPDVRTDGVKGVDRVGLLQLPGPRLEGIGPRCQRADRADVDQIAGELGIDRLLQGGDLGVLAAIDQAHLLDAADLRREADAARALDAAGHDGLDQRAHVLLGDRPLVLLVAALVEAEGHRLVLQVAFSALIADRAVQGVVDQQELHDALARLMDRWRVGVDHHAVAGRHGAGGDRLGRALHLDQAHAAVAGDRQAVVVAEARDLGAGQLAGLQHREAARDLDLLAVDGQLRHGPSLLRRRLAALALSDPALDLGPEVPDQSLDRPGRGIAERADRMALDLVGHVEQRVDLLGLGIAPD